MPHTTLRFALAAAALSAGTNLASAGISAPSSPHSIPCQDGTMRSSGMQPCVGHGGPRDAPVQVGTTGSAAPTQASPAAGATAHCKDGTYSMATHKTGACADHGGVGSWLVKGLPD